MREREKRKTPGKKMNLCYGFTNVLALSASAGNLTPANVKEMSDGDRCSSTEKRKTTDLVILKPWMLAGHFKKRYI